MLEHKKIMLARLKFFSTNKITACPEHIINSCMQIDLEINSFINLMIKYHITSKDNPAQRILDALDPLINHKYRILEYLLSKIDQQQNVMQCGDSRS